MGELCTMLASEQEAIDAWRGSDDRSRKLTGSRKRWLGRKDNAFLY